MTDDNFQLLTAYVTDRGLSEKRPQNEDSFLSMPQFGIFAVADGVGGAMAGDVASAMAVEIIGEAFANYSGTVDPEEIMTVAIDRANISINQMATELSQLSSMATTVVALHLAGNVATIAHVGDSRVYKLNAEGELSRETADHSVVEEEVRAGRMTPEQAANHPSRNVISRAVGAELSVEIDIKTIAVEPGTTFLLCSDGITRHVDDKEIADLLSTGMSVEMLCEQLKEMCYSRGAEDNLTAVIVKIPALTQTTQVAPLSDVDVADELHEEETITTARSPFDEPAEAVTSDVSIDDAAPLEVTDHFVPEAINSKAAASKILDETDDEAYLIEADPAPADEFLGFESELPPEAESISSEYASSRVIVPAGAAGSVPRERQQEFSMFGETPKANGAPHVLSPNIGNSLFRSLMFLLVGGLLGVAGFYLWSQNQPQPEQAQTIPVQDLTPKTSNIPASSLEELRWNIDKDPEAYLQQRSGTPQDPTDYYLMGRALFLVNKLWEAESQFKIVEAQKEKIVPTQSQISILSDIAMMRAIISSGPADVRFKADYTRTKGAIPSNSNTANANTSANSSRSLVP